MLCVRPVAWPWRGLSGSPQCMMDAVTSSAPPPLPAPDLTPLNVRLEALERALLPAPAPDAPADGAAGGAAADELAKSVREGLQWINKTLRGTVQVAWPWRVHVAWPWRVTMAWRVAVPWRVAVAWPYGQMCFKCSCSGLSVAWPWRGRGMAWTDPLKNADRPTFPRVLVWTADKPPSLTQHQFDWAVGAAGQIDGYVLVGPFAEAVGAEQPGKGRDFIDKLTKHFRHAGWESIQATALGLSHPCSQDKE
jgi:hypothetical protein